MARRRDGGGAPAVSLFPFLSILACVIGVLTLLITALAVAQLDPEEVRRVAAELEAQRERAARLAVIEQQMTTDRATLEALQNQLREKTNRAQRMAALMRDKASLEQQLSQQSKAAAERGGMVKELQSLAKAIKAAELERDQFATQAASMAGELDDRREAAAPPRVVVRPSGSGANLKPTFVECRTAEVVIHQGAESTSIKRGALATNEAYLELVGRIADAERETIVFLLREDGVGTYYTARNIARRNYARNGKLPIVGQGPIDLSLFQKAR